MQIDTSLHRPPTLEYDGHDIWTATAFDGSTYALVPWGSLRMLRHTPIDGGTVNLGVAGSIGEANTMMHHHEVTLPYAGVDEWTGQKIAG